MNPFTTQSLTLDHVRLRRDDPGEARLLGVRLGLVVQGGGMRGVYSMAALAALDHAGLSRVFDLAVGSSAGALNAAYLLTGQAKTGVSIYLDDIAQTHFMDPLRPFRWGDIDLLIDGVLTRSPKALDVEALRASHTELRIVLTDCRTAEPAVFSTRDDVEILQVLRATAALPVVRGAGVRVAGRDYVDGALVEAVPLSLARASACTDIVVVLTKPLGCRVGGLTGVRRMVATFLARNEQPALRDLITRPDERFNAAISFIENADDVDRGVNLAIIVPSDPRRMVSSTTTNRRKLEACVEMAWEDVSNVLGERLGPVPAHWRGP
jgi:predicted patatin/cPLA2 family phospholipase